MEGQLRMKMGIAILIKYGTIGIYIECFLKKQKGARKMDFSVFLDFDKAIFQWVEKAFDYGIAAVITPVLKFLTVLGDSGILWIALALVLLCFKKTRKVGATVLVALAVMTVCNNFVLKNLFAQRMMRQRSLRKKAF